MDPKSEQSKGFKSGIPVRAKSGIPILAIRPPSKLPVPISSKENQPKNHLRQVKSSVVKNVSTKAPLNPTNNSLASRVNGDQPSQKARQPVVNRAKENQSRLKHAEQNSETNKNVSSKVRQNTKQSEQAPISRKVSVSSQHARLKDQGYSKPFAKNSASSRLQTNTKTKKVLPTDKKTGGPVTSNKILTEVASRNQNDNIAKNRVVNTGIGQNVNTGQYKKYLNQMSKLDTDFPNQNPANVDKLAGTKKSSIMGVHVREIILLPVQLKKKNETIPGEEFAPILKTPEMANINLTEDKMVNKTPEIANIESTIDEITIDKTPELPNFNWKEDKMNDKTKLKLDKTPEMPDVILTEYEVKNETPYFSFDQIRADSFSNLKDISEKENKENNFLQSEVDFVPDERYRNQILSGQGISPMMKPKEFKSSTSGRMPSFFLKSKSAMKSLEKLEEEGRRAYMMRMSSLGCVRPSQPSVDTPMQEALRAMENVDLAAEDCRVSAIKKGRPPLLNSPYTRHSPMPALFQQKEDAYTTALKQIEALRMKNRAESTKKVTFSLDSSGSKPKVLEPNEMPRSRCFKQLKFEDETLEKKKPMSNILKNKKEKKKLCFSPPPQPKETTPELQLPASSITVVSEINDSSGKTVERNLPQSFYYNMLLRIADRVCSPDKKKRQALVDDRTPGNVAKPSDKVSLSVKRVTSETMGTHSNRFREAAAKQTRDSLYLQHFQPIQDRRFSALALNNPSIRNSLQKMSSTAKPALEDGRYGLYLPRRQAFEPVLEDARYSLYLPRRPQPNLEGTDSRRSTLSKLITPKPISLYPKPGNQDSISPEFLCRRTSQIVAPAPITTPMVLRTMAANLEDSLSPTPEEGSLKVCQRLDFEDEIEGKATIETKRASTASPFKLKIMPVRGIQTYHQMLDNLAEEECRTFSDFVSIPETAQRSFKNPVAHMLSYGTDMHFAPLRL